MAYEEGKEVTGEEDRRHNRVLVEDEATWRDFLAQLAATAISGFSVSSGRKKGITKEGVFLYGLGLINISKRIINQTGLSTLLD